MFPLLRKFTCASDGKTPPFSASQGVIAKTIFTGLGVESESPSPAFRRAEAGVSAPKREKPLQTMNLALERFTGRRRAARGGLRMRSGAIGGRQKDPENRILSRQAARASSRTPGRRDATQRRRTPPAPSGNRSIFRQAKRKAADSTLELECQRRRRDASSGTPSPAKSRRRGSLRATTIQAADLRFFETSPPP
jgi:hypothetical protein